MADQIDKEFLIGLGAKITAARKRSKLAQGKLSQLLGLARTSVTNIEKGRQPVYVHVLVKIAKITNSSISDLIPITEHTVQKQSITALKDKDVRSWVENLISKDGSNYEQDK